MRVPALTIVSPNGVPPSTKTSTLLLGAVDHGREGTKLASPQNLKKNAKRLVTVGQFSAVSAPKKKEIHFKLHSAAGLKTYKIMYLSFHKLLALNLANVYNLSLF